MRTVRLVALMPLLAAPLHAQGHAAEPPAPAQITGTLLGAGGEPMPLAHVSLWPVRGETRSKGEPLPSAISTVAVEPDGEFALAVHSTGVFTVWFTGVHHMVAEAVVLIQSLGEHIKIDARLATHDYKDDFSGVRVIGDFNDFSFVRDVRDMEPQEDGTYLLEVKVGEDADSLAYQLVGITQRRTAVNGTASEWYVYDNDVGYRSVIAAEKGTARISFDPAALVAVDAEPHVAFLDPGSLAARYGEFRQHFAEQNSAFFVAQNELRERRASVEEQRAFATEYDWSPSHALLDSALAETDDPHLREILFATYLALSFHPDSLRARRALAEIPPASPSWMLQYGLLEQAINASGQPEAYEEYAYAALREHTDPDLRTGVLSHLLDRASQEGRKELIRVLFSWLLSEYPESFEAEWAKAEYDPARAIQPGTPVPLFAVASLEDSTTIYSDESLKGRVYLMEFWAVWCLPCIAKMPALHAAYEEYRDEGFTILSLSFDRAPEDVTEYRGESGWSMPWLHAFVEGGFASDLATTFQVLGIPKPILVGADGIILATAHALEGEKLDETLARVSHRGASEAKR